DGALRCVDRQHRVDRLDLVQVPDDVDVLVVDVRRDAVPQPGEGLADVEVDTGGPRLGGDVPPGLRHDAQVAAPRDGLLLERDEPGTRPGGGELAAGLGCRLRYVDAEDGGAAEVLGVARVGRGGGCRQGEDVRGGSADAHSDA